MRHINFSAGITEPEYVQERRMRLHHNEKYQYPLILGKLLSGFILLSTIMPSYATAASKVTYTPLANPAMTVQQAKGFIEKISKVCQSNVSDNSDDCVIWPPNTADPDTSGNRVESITFNKNKLNIAAEGGNYSFPWKGMHVTSGTFGYGSIFMISYPVVFISGAILSLYDNDSSKFYRQVADAITVIAAEKRSELAADNLAFQKVAKTYRNAKVKPVPGENVRKFVIMADEAVHQERFSDAVNDYEQGLKIAPWWPQGHFNASMILGKLHEYNRAIEHMKDYLMLVPNAPNTRAAQDQIYKWEADKQAAMPAQ